MRRLMGVTVVGLGLLLAGLTARAADTLVVAEGGAFKPGLAASWSQSGDATVFVLQEGVDGAAIAATLTERLAQAKVSFDQGKLIIAGIPQAALLEQLAALSVVGEGDLLAALAGLQGGGPTLAVPEGGGSIRASKPTPLSGVPIPVTHDPAERLDAEVLAVRRGEFPQVTLKLKVRRAPKAGTLKSKLKAGRVVELPVLLAGAGAQVDLSQPLNQTNLGAYYLRKGDRIRLHALEAADGQLAIDWLERE